MYSYRYIHVYISLSLYIYIYVYILCMPLVCASAGVGRQKGLKCKFMKRLRGAVRAHHNMNEISYVIKARNTI